MTRIADLLGLPPEGGERLWVVASNGAVVFRYPPLEVVHEETFDARPAVEAVLARAPDTRWSRSRSAASATASTGRSRRASSPAR